MSHEIFSDLESLKLAIKNINDDETASEMKKEISWEEWEECQRYEFASKAPKFVSQEFEEKHWNKCIEPEKFMSSMMGIKWEGSLISSAVNKSIIEIGSGPWGLTLRTKDALSCYAVEPLKLPSFCVKRYKDKGIKFVNKPGELITLKSLELDQKFDEVWMSNVLQHTQNPFKILENLTNLGKIIRIFEWVEIPPHEGHPWKITADLIKSELTKGADCIKSDQQYLNVQQGSYLFLGNVFAGIFKTD